MKKLSKIFLLIALSVVPMLAQAIVYTVETVPSPKAQGQEFYVYNPDTVLVGITENELNERLLALQKNTDVEMAIVAINEYDEERYSAHEFALKLFNAWGIGDAEKNTGVLLLLAKGNRDIQFITGDGIAGIMTDLKCGEILDNAIPFLRDNDYDGAVLRIMTDVEELLMSDKNRAELLLGYKEQDTEDAAYGAGYFMFAFVMLILFAWYAYKKLNGKPGQSKKEIQDQSKGGQTCLGCAMFVFPIPLLFFYLYYRYARKHAKMTPPNCKKCGHVMTEMPEQDELALLTKGQMVEQQLESVDYSIWTCPECKAEEFLQFNGPRYKQYKVCPECNTRALKLTKKEILTNATYSHAGEQMNYFTCQCCGQTRKEACAIPKKVYSSGSSSSSSSGSWGGGSSHSSGSWGGGHSSGGGAGRSW